MRTLNGACVRAHFNVTSIAPCTFNTARVSTPVVAAIIARAALVSQSRYIVHTSLYCIVYFIINLQYMFLCKSCEMSTECQSVAMRNNVCQSDDNLAPIGDTVSGLRQSDNLIHFDYR